MPYIPLKDAAEFNTGLMYLEDTIEQRGITNGELNFLMTMLAKFYIKRHGTSYNTLSDVIKAFECAKLEFYRRMVVPYEDKKREENGDVYLLS
jgi:hypothetical protein